MKPSDFRYIRRGKQLSNISPADLKWLKPINQCQKGNENALLVLHGFSSSPAVYRYLIPKIKQYNAIVCPVLPGHADSIDAFSHAKAQDWVLTAQKHCHQLITSYQQVDVLGLSLGGLLACQLSQLHPIHRLFLLAPAIQLKMNINRMLFIARALKNLGFQHLRNTAGNLITDEHAEIAYKKIPLSAIIEMLQFAKNYQWAPPKCPVDLFLGRYDEIVDSKQVEQRFAPLPNTTIHWLDHSAHVLPLDNDVEQIVQCIRLRNNLNHHTTHDRHLINPLDSP